MGLSGTYKAAALGAWTGHHALELTRVDDVNPKIRLADPRAEPPRDLELKRTEG